MVVEKSPAFVGQARDHFSRIRYKEYKGHTAKVHALAWSGDGRRVASGSADKTVRIWQWERSTTSTTELKGHADLVDQVRWDPKHADRLCSSSGDKTVKLWDIRTNRATTTMTTEAGNINLAWHPDGNTIVVGNVADTVNFIDTRKGKISEKKSFPDQVGEMTWNIEGNLLFIPVGYEILVYEWPSMQHIHTLKGHTGNVNSLAIDSKGRCLASGGAEGLVALWDLSELLCLRTFNRLQYPVRSLAFFYDANILAMAAEDPFIDLSHWEGDYIWEVPSIHAVFAVATHPSRHLLAYAPDDPHRRHDEFGFKVCGFNAATPGALPYPSSTTAST